MSTQKFHQLFKKYRLRSEFESLAELGKALAEEGVVYDDSAFTNWQSGKRIPRDRNTILALLTAFIKRGGVTSLEEANLFFESAGQGYLTAQEIKKLPQLSESTPFLVPQKPALLLPRDQPIQEASTLLIAYKIILLHGQAGIGKSVTAIELAYKLESEFPDGVLWFRADITPVSEILNLIGEQYNKTVSHIQDIYAKASIIRSYFSKKRILYIYDNVEQNQNIELLLPNASGSAVIITSQFTNYNFLQPEQIVSLQRLSEQESLSLFKIILGYKYAIQNENKLKKIAQLLSGIPLAIQVTAKQLASQNYTVDEVISFVEPQNIDLKEFKYGNKNLYSSIKLCFQTLNDDLTKIMISLAAFHGPDFSLEAVTNINDTTMLAAKKALTELISYSLVEHSSNGRYRLHPFIAYFLSKEYPSSAPFEKAAEYYTQKLYDLLENKIRNELIFQEQENIIGVIEQCYQQKKFIYVCKFIDRFGVFLWETGQWERLKDFTKIAYESARKAKVYESQMLLCNREFVWIYFWNGQVKIAERYIRRGLELAKKHKNLYHINLSKLRLVRVYITKKRLKKAKNLISDALKYYQNINDFYRLSMAYRFLVEINILEEKYQDAKKNIKKSIGYLEKTKIEKYIITYKSFNKTNLGTIYFLEGDYKKAKKILNSCLDMEKEVKSFTRNRIIIHTVLGVIAERENNKQKEEEEFLAAEKVYRELGIETGFEQVAPILISIRRRL